MTFHLQVVTPDGLAFEGEAEKLSVRTQDGIIGILPRHIDYVAPLGMGEAVITEAEGKVRRAACIGGMVAVHNGAVRLVATTFEWADQIDLDRAKAAEKRPEILCPRTTSPSVISSWLKPSSTGLWYANPSTGASEN